MSQTKWILREGGQVHWKKYSGNTACKRKEIRKNEKATEVYCVEWEAWNSSHRTFEKKECVGTSYFKRWWHKVFQIEGAYQAYKR